MKLLNNQFGCNYFCNKSILVFQMPILQSLTPTPIIPWWVLCLEHLEGCGRDVMSVIEGWRQEMRPLGAFWRTLGTGAFRCPSWEGRTFCLHHVVSHCSSQLATGSFLRQVPLQPTGGGGRGSWLSNSQERSRTILTRNTYVGTYYVSGTCSLLCTT